MLCFAFFRLISQFCLFIRPIPIQTEIIRFIRVFKDDRYYFSFKMSLKIVLFSAIVATTISFIQPVAEGIYKAFKLTG